MGTRTTDRRQRLDDVRAQQARSERRSRFLALGGAAAGVAAVVTGVAVAIATSGPSSGGPIVGLTTVGDLSRTHTDGAVGYEGAAPVGGEHSPVWQNCGWYDTQVVDENAVHSLEHGAVWLTYRPELAAADRSALRELLDGREYVLASPRPGLPSPVVASAWGLQVVLDGVSDPRLLQFVETYAGAPSAPEPGAACSAGVGELA